MPERYPVGDLSEADIRRLLQRRIHTDRQDLLEHYRKTGRRILLIADHEEPGLPTYHSELLPDPQTQNRFTRIPAPGERVLKIVEAAAMIGLLLVILAGWNFLRHTNHAAESAYDLPALTPTPLIRAVVIPSGHTAPDATGHTYPNLAEIPVHLQPLLQSQASQPIEIPTPAPEQGIRIRIPAIDVDAPIVQGDGWEQLQKGVAQHLGTAGPGQNGNMVLSGHNDVYGEVFRYLDQLKPGDQVVIYSARRAYTYIITGWTLVEPTQVEVMDQTPDATLTLISCYPYLIDNQRIIVKAQLADA
ncbi:MAG: sortase [Chloroflexota bacterium]|nr:MAG: sortase [Chloroflexota bacterium]